jgi:hypothetical protein
MPNTANTLATLSLAEVAASRLVSGNAQLRALPQDSAGLVGRRAECNALDELLNGVRAGESRALVIHGEPGVGKTALLEYIGDRTTGCRVIRANDEYVI